MTEHRFLRALRREPHDGIPVWFMRQAGRYLPGYQKVRAKTDFLTLCKTPDLAAEVTLEPLDTFGVDATIIFSDILVPLEAMGMTVVFTDRGPCMENPIDSAAEIDALRVPDPNEDLGYVMDIVREVKRRVDGRVPVIGFAGAPFTLACYALEGSPSRTFEKAMRMVYQSPREMHALLDKIATAVTAHLKAQIDAGCDVIQLFDTWGGLLPYDAFREISLGYCQRIMHELADCGVPRILFIKGAGMYIDEVVGVGTEAIGVDYMTQPQYAVDRVQGRAAIQGNLPPHALLGSEPELRRRVRELLEVYGHLDGYVFNLGHGILPPTPVDHVHAVIDEIRSFGKTS